MNPKALSPYDFKAFCLAIHNTYLIVLDTSLCYEKTMKNSKDQTMNLLWYKIHVHNAFSLFVSFNFNFYQKSSDKKYVDYL
jgi:hypothetical protein